MLYQVSMNLKYIVWQQIPVRSWHEIWLQSIEVLEKHESLGCWEFSHLPFDLNNAPATYRRLMEECLSIYNMNICATYLDDFIIFSDSL